MCTSSWRMTRPQLNGWRMPLAVGRHHGDHPARAGADGVQIGQGDGPAAEHLVIVEHLDQDRPRRVVIELGRQVLVDLLEVLRHVASQRASCLRIVAQLVVLGFQGFILVEVPEHLAHVGDADIEGVGLEALVEQRPGLFLLAQAHVEQAQAVGRAGQAWLAACSLPGNTSRRRRSNGGLPDVRRARTRTRPACC